MEMHAGTSVGYFSKDEIRQRLTQKFFIDRSRRWMDVTALKTSGQVTFRLLMLVDFRRDEWTTLDANDSIAC